MDASQAPPTEQPTTTDVEPSLFVAEVARRPIWRQADFPTLLFRSLLLLFLSGASLGLALWYLELEELLAFTRSNRLSTGTASVAVLYSIVGGALFVLIPASYLSIRLRRDALVFVERISELLCPLLLIFAVPLFLRPELWTGQELYYSVVIVLWGLILERTLRVSFAAWSEISSSGGPLRLMLQSYRYPHLKQWLPGIALGVLVSAFVGYISFYAIRRHLLLDTASFDLAIWDNLMWNLLRGEWFYSSPVMGLAGSHIQHHATFTAYLLAPFYALYQRAEALLVLQAALTGLAAVPLYGLAKRHLASTGMAITVSAAYLMYGPLHGPNFYDFHFLTISPVFVLTALYFFETRKNAWFAVALALALLTREDIGFGLGFAFLFYLLSGERPRIAIIGGIVSFSCFFLMKFVVMPAHGPATATGGGFIEIYQALVPSDARSYFGVLRTLYTNPIYTGSKLFTELKFSYALAILGPVLLLPLRHSKAWILLITGALLTLLATQWFALFSTAFQYTAQWTPYVFVATIVAIGAWQTKPEGFIRMRAGVAALLIVGALMTRNFGAFFHDNSFRGGFAPMSFEFTPTDVEELAALRALMAHIPKDASVTASESEAPHLSNRKYCFTLRNGHHGSDYVLARISEGQGGPKGLSKATMTQVIRSGQYGIVETRGPFQLWKKGADQSGNADAARALRIRPAG